MSDPYNSGIEGPSVMSLDDIRFVNELFAATPSGEGRVGMQREQALAHAINCHSMENDSDTPDFVLAEFLRLCLTAWNYGIVGRERYYQRNVAVPIPPSAAPKSLEIPREIAALRELIACADWAQELDAVDDVPNDIDIGACGTRFSEAWAAARSALAMYDQERG